MPKHPPLDTREAVCGYVDAELAAAVSAPAHGWHWPALTTAGTSRIVVLRDYEAAGPELTWYTDRRSDKVAELRRDPACALLFYHADHRIQLRVDAIAVELSDEAERTRRWSEVGAAARANYATVHPPGSPLGGPSTDLPTPWPTPGAAEAARAFANFAVYHCRVTTYELLQLLDIGAYRSRWRPGDPSDFTFLTP